MKLSPSDYELLLSIQAGNPVQSVSPDQEAQAQIDSLARIIKSLSALMDEIWSGDVDKILK